MIRVLLLLATLGTLASCGQYREPEANCFAFRASMAAVEPDCIFTPLEASERDVAV